MDITSRLFGISDRKQGVTLTAPSPLDLSLKLGLLPRLGSEQAKLGGFQGWLSCGTFVPQKPTSNSEVTLERVRIDEIVPFINFDYERFALSCRETYEVYSLENSKFKLTGWPVLKAYYSSFFSAHSIMRSRGFGVSKLTNKPIDYLNSILKTYFPAEVGILPGMYHYEIEIVPGSTGEAKVHLKQFGKNGGVHETFWISFVQFLSAEATKAVLTGLPEASGFLAEVDDLSDAIKTGSSSSHAWLSSMRNEVNYQHLHETWFPIKKSSPSLKALDPIPTLKSAHLGISKNKSPVLAFLNISLYITAVGVSVADFVAERSTKSNAFGQKWRRMKEMIDGI